MQDNSLLDPATSFRHQHDGDMYSTRRCWRTASKKSFCLIFGCFCFVTIVYMILAKPGFNFSSFNVYKLTQNVYFDRKEDTSIARDSVPSEDYFCIVFDAGSTGTRIHIFHFKKEQGGSLKLVKDIFKKVKPGLSSYADNPDKGVESVKGLLNVAKEYVPHDKWYKTPLVLRATAGLRLLPGKKAELILNGVKRLFMGCLFQKLGDDFVSIMDGDSEGIYGWLTVNYLTEKLKPVDVSKMYGALDLGGGSVQITIPLNGKEVDTTEVPKTYVKSVDISPNSYTLYTHSYLGLGLMSARAAILNESAVGHEDSKHALEISSPCFPAGYSDVWKFAGHSFLIKGTDQCSFENCRDFAKKVVLRNGMNRPAQVKNVNIFAFSYFFDRATELGLIDEESGGNILVQNYVDAAQTVCERGSVNGKPFLCMDTTYISTLLTDGFGLDLHHQLLLKRNINDFDVSWAVGAALDLYEKAKKMSRN